MLLLAFDTATDVATSALVDDGRVLGERTSVPPCWRTSTSCSKRGASPADLDALVVGTGPGSLRARGSASRSRRVSGSLELPVAGISTLEARECEGRRLPGRRRSPPRGLRLGPRVLAPAALELEPGTTVVGSGQSVSGDARGQGAHVPADDDEIHHPTARACMRLSRASSCRRRRSRPCTSAPLM